MVPAQGGGRQASFYDPKTQKWQLIETCYSTHHLQFDNDPDETVYFNELSGPIFGWIDTKVYEKALADTKDERKAEQTAVGWCGQVVDTNGDGRSRDRGTPQHRRLAATSSFTRATPVAGAPLLGTGSRPTRWRTRRTWRGSICALRSKATTPPFI